MKRGLTITSLAALTLMGAACAGSDQPGRPSATDSANTEARAGTSKEFALAVADRYSDELDDVVFYSGQAGDAAQDLDLGGAADASERTADIYDDLVDGTEGFPGADSEFGRAARRAWKACAAAYQDGADALRSFDGDAIERSTDAVSRCGDLTSDATDLIRD